MKKLTQPHLNTSARKKIQVGKILEDIGVEPHEGQKPIIKAYLNGKREIVWVSGRRSGKSMILGVIAAMESMIPGSKIWIVAPDYGLAERVFNYLLQYVSKIYPEGTFKVTSKPGMNIRFDNGSIVECKSGDNPNCFDEDTEILTDSGWKFFKDLDKNDLVFVRDNGVSKWQKTKRIIKQNYSGEMISINSKSFDSLTTPNHRFLVKKNYSQKEEIVEAVNLNTKDTIPTTSKWIGEDREYFTIPSIIKRFSTYSFECEPILVDIKDWCAFMGIFLSEGSCAGSMGGMSSINSGNYQVFISQTKSENRKIIRDLFEKLPFNYREKKDGFEILNKQLWNYLKQFGNKYQKFIPKEIKELSSDNLKVLIDWLILGDGCIHKGQRYYYTTSEKLANDFQEILQKIGKYGIIKKRKQNISEIKGRKINSIGYIWEIVEKNREFNSLCSSKENYISKINYSGNVYCCETDAGIIYVRRNGKPYWSGNSLLGEELDLLIIDEAAMMSPNVYERYLFATTAIRSGITIFISTPNRKNWFYRKYETVKDSEDGFVFNTPSSINPYMKKEEIERAREKLPQDMFKQEYLAEFLDTGAGVFRGFNECKVTNYKEEPKGSHRYVMGVDLAKINDFTVITVIDKQTHQVVYWERFNGIEWALVIKKVANIANKYNKAKVIIDSTGVGNPVTEAIKREAEGLMVEDFKFASNKTSSSKKDIIDKLSIFIENKAIKIPDEPELLDELDCYACEMTESGIMKYSAPLGKHDDCLKEGTLIKTIDGYKPIEDIEIGELVLTHKNRYRKVIKSIKKEFNGDWYKFNFQCQTPLELSYNHPIYSAIKKYGKNDGNLNYSKREWILPKDWKSGYRCVSLIEKIEQNKNIVLREEDFYKRGKQSTRNKLSKIKLDKSFAKFLGLFLAEGHATNFDKNNYTCSLSFNKNHKELIEEMKRYILSLGISVQEREYGNTSNAFALVFSSKFIHTILTYCYDKNREKQIPYYAKYLGKDLKYVLEYWLKGDGWKAKTHYIGATTSKSLGLSMRDISFSIGKYASIRRIKRHRYNVPTKDQYWVEIYDKWDKTNGQRKLSSFEYGSKIKGIGSVPNIEKTTFNGYVYNIQVEEDESFIADGKVVHNCVISLALAVSGLSNPTPRAEADDLFKSELKNILLEEREPHRTHR